MHGLYPKLAKKAMLYLSLASAFFLAANPVLALVPNDPMYAFQRNFFEQINAPAAWDYTVGSKKVVVATIDTGLDTSHNDLMDNLWVNIHEIPGNKKDDDHNGYVDDINGWNFVENNADVRTSVFYSEDDNEAVRHGTLVGGLIGAVGNNGEAGVGVSWNVSLMALRAIKSSGSGSTQAVKRAVEYAVHNGADIISMSFMGEVSDTELYNSLRRAHERGVLIITAGGNYDSDSETGNLNQKPLYPACYDVEDGLNENWILTVGSVDLKDKISDFSNFGKCLDILAPGEYIYSTERYAPQFDYDDEFGGPWFGTSFATPIVAGAAALIKSIHPEWSPIRIISTLINTAESVADKNPGLSVPRINVEAGVALASAYPKVDPQGAIYYVRGSSELWKYDLSENTAEKIARFSDANILALNVYNYLNREQTAVLLRRGQKFAVRLVHASGEFIKEIPVPNGAFSPTDKFQMRYVNNDWQVVGVSVNSKQTNFKIYHLQNKKLIRKTVQNNVDSWGILPNGNIAAGSVSKTTMQLEVISPTESRKIAIPNVGKLHTLSARSSDKVIGLIQKGSGLHLLKINLIDGSQDLVSLGLKAGKQTWNIKSLGFGERVQYIPFSRSGGSFVAYDEDLTPTLTVNLGSIPASTQ